MIMRSLQRMDWGAVSIATRQSVTRVHESWSRGIMQLQKELQKDGLREHCR